MQLILWQGKQIHRNSQKKIHHGEALEASPTADYCGEKGLSQLLQASVLQETTPDAALQ